jgi:hypothetical protein
VEESAVKSPAHAADQPVDPIVHGRYLTDLHQVTIETENGGRLFQQILEEEIEPAIKELSSCLLYADGPRSELDECVQKFENALSHMRSAQQSLHARIARIRELGEHFPAG